MSFNTDTPIKVLGGNEIIKRNAGEFERFGKKCLIVTGGKSALLSGALTDVAAALESVNIRYEIFDKIGENPKTAACCMAGEEARKFDADFIIGIGGGSPLDSAKAVAVYAANENFLPDDIYTCEIKNEPLPVILVGTTAGTGSEVTGISVLTANTGKKKSVKGKNYYASLAFADGRYTYSVPYSVTVSTALDVLAHSVEAYLSSAATEEAKEYAEKALPVVWSELKRLYFERTLPTNEAREMLYDASLFAGQALNICGTCFPHTMGYFLTEKYNIPHGKACAVFLPDFLKRGMEYKMQETDSIFKLLNTNFDTFKDIVSSLADVRITVPVEQVDAYLPFWQSVKNFDNSPGGFNPYLAKAVMIKLFVEKE